MIRFATIGSNVENQSDGQTLVAVGQMGVFDRGCVKTYSYFVFWGLLTLPHSKIIACSSF
jgi:hypothetical protein